MKSLGEHFPSVFDLVKLKTELSAVYHSKQFQGLSVGGIKDVLNHDVDYAFTEVAKLCDLIRTIPCTTASVERSFSALKRLKGYLRNTMGQQRLCNVSIIPIERELIAEMVSEGKFHQLVLDEFLLKNRRSEFHFKV